MSEMPAPYTVGDPGDETHTLSPYVEHGTGKPCTRGCRTLERCQLHPMCWHKDTTPRLGYTSAEVAEVAPEEYQLKPFLRLFHCHSCDQMQVADQAHVCRKGTAVGMAPTYEELAAAVQAFDDGLFPLNMPLPPSLALAWNDVWGQMTMLAERLPKGR